MYLCYGLFYLAFGAPRTKLLGQPLPKPVSSIFDIITGARAAEMMVMLTGERQTDPPASRNPRGRHSAAPARGGHAVARPHDAQILHCGQYG